MRSFLPLLCLMACRGAPVEPPPLETPAASEAPAATGPTPAPVVAAEPAEPPPPGPNIGVREVDWSNFDYDGFVYLQDGRGYLHEYMEDYDGMHDSTEWNLIGAAYGDLDEDGDEEAAIAIAESFWTPDGASSSTTVVFVFTGHPLQRLAGERLAACEGIAIEGTRVVLTRPSRVQLELAGDRLLLVEDS